MFVCFDFRTDHQNWRAGDAGSPGPDETDKLNHETVC